MSNQKQEIKKERLEKITLTCQPKLVITEKLQKQINFLHSKVGRNEWSGELITHEIGTINDLGDWTIVADEIFLADVGSGAYTGYQVDRGGFKAVDIIQMYDKYPGLLDGSLKNHHIHTHHDMGAFFSGTDMENLEDRGVDSNYFLMLIVDFAGKYKAKVAFKARKKDSGSPILEFVNNEDGFTPIQLRGSDDKEILVIMDCRIEYDMPPVVIDQDFEERYAAVVKALEEEKKVKEFKPGIEIGRAHV